MIKLSTVDLFKYMIPQNSVVLKEEELLLLQKEELSILNDIQDLCEEEGISFMLGGGTALGAVRIRALFRGTMMWISICPARIMNASCVLFPKSMGISTGFIRRRRQRDMRCF